MSSAAFRPYKRKQVHEYTHSHSQLPSQHHENCRLVRGKLLAMKLLVITNFCLAVRLDTVSSCRQEVHHASLRYVRLPVPVSRISVQIRLRRLRFSVWSRFRRPWPRLRWPVRRLRWIRWFRRSRNVRLIQSVSRWNDDVDCATFNWLLINRSLKYVYCCAFIMQRFSWFDDATCMQLF